MRKLTFWFGRKKFPCLIKIPDKNHSCKYYSIDFVIFSKLSYVLIVLILSLVLLPGFIYSARSPMLFWHYKKRKNTLHLYKKTEIIKEISCNNLALSIRIGGHSTGAQWILVSPQMGDIETLLITENLLLYGKNYDFFAETTNRLAQYTGLRRTVDTF